MTEPTEEDYAIGRDLASDAEIYGAESDSAEVGDMIARAIAEARAEGYAAGLRDVADSVRCDTQPTTMTTNNHPEEGQP